MRRQNTIQIMKKPEAFQHVFGYVAPSAAPVKSFIDLVTEDAEKERQRKKTKPQVTLRMR